MKDRFTRWLAHRLPARVAYFTAIRVLAHATTGRYNKQNVPALTAMEAIARFKVDCVD